MSNRWAYDEALGTSRLMTPYEDAATIAECQAKADLLNACANAESEPKPFNRQNVSPDGPCQKALRELNGLDD